MLLKRWLFVLIIMCFSCENAPKKKSRNDVPGDYFTLADDHIKLFLPAYFREFSELEYAALLDQLPDSEEKEMELKRFNYLKFSKGNIYYFKDVASSTLISLKMGQFLPFTREESAYLLGVLSNSCSAYGNALNLNCEKLSAGYSDTKRTKVFKANFKLTNGQDFESFNTVYFVSSNYKTFAINIFSNTNKNYNSFIEKLIVN